MGGQGRGVLSDFKMSRVRRPKRLQAARTNNLRSTTSEWRLWLEIYLVSREPVGKKRELGMEWDEEKCTITWLLGIRPISRDIIDMTV
jgi:hypothetical protein